MIGNLNNFKKNYSNAWDDLVVILNLSWIPFWYKTLWVTSDTVEHWVESVPTKDASLLLAFTDSASIFLGKKHWSFFWPTNSDDVAILAILGKCILLWAARNVLMLGAPPCPLLFALMLIFISAEQQIFCCWLANDATAISNNSITTWCHFLELTKWVLSSDAWNKLNTPPSGINLREITALPFQICWISFSM